MPILARPDAKRPGPPRRWRVLRPPARRIEPFEACEVLDEVGGALGLELWRAVRDVLIWLDTPPEHCSGLFHKHESTAQLHDAIISAPVLANALNTFHELARKPQDSDRAVVGEACHQVAEWAAERGYAGTYLAFAEAAAYTKSENGEYALDAGLAARHRGSFGRAEHWYRRGLAVARRDGDHPTYVVAYIRRGVLDELMGKPDRARLHQLRAWRAAKRFKLRKLGAYAQHELLVLGITTRPFEELQKHAELACELYGRFDARFPQMAHDVAFLWAWHGYFAAALPVYEAVLGYVTKPSERIQVIANIGRAAAAAGDAERFYHSWDEVSRYANEAAEWKPTALLSLAHGAATFGWRSKARQLANDALATARSLNLTANEQQIRDFLDLLQVGRAKDTARDVPAELERIAALLIRRLSKRRREPSSGI